MVQPISGNAPRPDPAAGGPVDTAEPRTTAFAGNWAASAGEDPTAGRTAVASAVASEHARIIGDPAPLGLAAFALTTFILSLVNAKIIPVGTLPVVLGLALAYGGIGQLIAGIWEFRKGNTFGATAFVSYGAFWISFWALVTFYLPTIPGAEVGTAVGWFLVGWGMFTAFMLLASLRTTAALVVVFAALTATFILLGVGNLTGHSGLVTTGGWLGIVTAAAAWYAALAGVLRSTFGHGVLPNPELRGIA